jgi:hypothetical protein
MTYIYYRNLQFLSIVIMIKTKVLIPQEYVTLPILATLLRIFYCSQILLKLFGFPIIRPWEYLMKVIPETRRAH